MSLENAKRQRLDKLERRRFEVPLEFQSMEFALILQQMLSSKYISRRFFNSLYISADGCSEHQPAVGGKTQYAYQQVNFSCVFPVAGFETDEGKAVRCAADCNRPKRDDRYKRDDRRADDRERRKERYKRDEEDNERNVDSEGETSTQSRSAYDKFNKMSFVKADMIYNCLESVKYDNQNSPKLSDNGKAGIDFSKPESFKPNWLKNRLDKDKAKAGQKPFVPNQSWHNSKKSTRSVLGKCVYLITLAMSLFDLQDVCIAIGSIATLDLPMIVDLIGIYGLKGPYCTLTTTDWFLQALSVILLGIRIRPPIRKSGPRPDPRLLCQTALEVLTRSARSDSPRKTRPEQIPAKLAAAAGGSGRRTAAT
ncbi:hypothetical protein F511_40355 [Dorcoceras hygrometricum]|uniref:Uncharacterized protein n=1 Tax=Dorcoceras hygrometricum TaxID=472368 RepID=A0A2Z7C128_9LAMI|nr:hypothetical protein F511_40355 [Dorcoceras hygrometricum]